MQYSVKLQAFEGPLDLLLHLIQKNDLDIYDIPAAEITDQYMNYIKTMKVLQLDIASEYLVMAATLLEMKSSHLLPRQEDDFEDDEMLLDEEEDPRDDLMKRLIEYKRYKEAAGHLREKEVERSRLFSKPVSNLSALSEEEERDVSEVDVTLYDMLDAFSRISSRKKEREPVYSTVRRDEYSIDERMTEIVDVLGKGPGRVPFEALFEERSRPQKVITFLAVLELMKSKMIGCDQEGNFDSIVVYQT
ncbi:segregation/condensation protein A [Alteribacter natronophilus]|uniref:segregation/condensation protein A n=1 Tax=Alteribacter natronophilus TaxID=2583810 RepID=UPI00110EA17D|nr:segregation/condensation protein A [Alteribacter natronophilus]TMW73661.1 segregation/condensation protein A [Alteribacter natronophilus]